MFFLLHLDSFFVQAVDFLVQLVNRFILESVIAVFCIQFLNQSLKLFLFSLDVDGVSFEIVMFLFFELLVEFFIQLIDNVIELLLGSKDYWVFVDEFLVNSCLTKIKLQAL